jgi:hypothetical protein
MTALLVIKIEDKYIPDEDKLDLQVAHWVLPEGATETEIAWIKLLSQVVDDYFKWAEERIKNNNSEDTEEA